MITQYICCCGSPTSIPCALLPYVQEDEGNRWLKLNLQAFSCSSQSTTSSSRPQAQGGPDITANSESTTSFSFPALSGVVNMSQKNLSGFAQGTYSVHSSNSGYAPAAAGSPGFPGTPGGNFSTTYDETGVIIMTDVTAAAASWSPKAQGFAHLGRAGADAAGAVSVSYAAVFTSKTTTYSATAYLFQGLDANGQPNPYTIGTVTETITQSQNITWGAGASPALIITSGIAVDTGYFPPNVVIRSLGFAPTGGSSSGLAPPTTAQTIAGALPAPLGSDMPIEIIMAAGAPPFNGIFGGTTYTGSQSPDPGSHTNVGTAQVYPYDPSSNLLVDIIARPVGGPLDGSEDLTRFAFVKPTQATDTLPKEYLPGTLMTLGGESYYVAKSCAETFDCAADLDWAGSYLPGNPINIASSVARWALTVDDSGTIYYAMEAVAVGDTVVVEWWSGVPRCGIVSRVEATQDGTGSVPTAWRVPANWQGCNGYVIATPCNPNFPSVWAFAGAAFAPLVKPTPPAVAINLNPPAGNYNMVKIPGTEGQGGPFFQINFNPYDGSQLAFPADADIAHAIAALPAAWMAALAAYNAARSAPVSGAQAPVDAAGSAWQSQFTSDALSPSGCAYCAAAQSQLIPGTSCDGSVSVFYNWWAKPTATWGTASPAPAGAVFTHIQGYLYDPPTSNYILHKPWSGCLSFGSPQGLTDVSRRNNLRAPPASTGYADCPSCQAANPYTQILGTACADGTPTELYYSPYDSAQPDFVIPVVGKSYTLTSHDDGGGTGTRTGFDGALKITAINAGAGDATKNNWYPGNGQTKPALEAQTFDLALVFADSSTLTTNATQAKSIGSQVRVAGGYAPKCGTVTSVTPVACYPGPTSDNYGSGCGILPALKITTTSCATGAVAEYYLQEGGPESSGSPGAYPNGTSPPRVGDVYRTGQADPPPPPPPGGDVPLNETVTSVEIQDSSFGWPSGARAWDDLLGVVTPPTILLTNPAAAETPIADAYSAFMAYYTAQIKYWTDQYDFAAYSGSDPAVQAQHAATLLADQADLAAKQNAYAPLKTVASNASASANTCTLVGGFIKITAQPLDMAIAPTDYYADPLSDDHIPAVNEVYLQAIPNANDGLDVPTTMVGTGAVKVTAVSARGQGRSTMPHWAPSVGPYASGAPTPLLRVTGTACNGIIYHQQYFYLDKTTSDPVPVVGSVFKVGAIATGIPVQIAAIDEDLGLTSYPRLWDVFNASYGFENCAEACPTCSGASGCDTAVATMDTRDPYLGDTFWFAPSSTEAIIGDCYMRQAFTSSPIISTQHIIGPQKIIIAPATTPPPPTAPAGETLTQTGNDGGTYATTTTYAIANLVTVTGTFFNATPGGGGLVFYPVIQYIYDLVSSTTVSATAATTPMAIVSVKYGEGNQSTTPIATTGLPPLPSLTACLAKTAGAYQMRLYGQLPDYSASYYYDAQQSDSLAAPKIGDLYRLTNRPDSVPDDNPGPWCARLGYLSHTCAPPDPAYVPDISSLATKDQSCACPNC